MLMVWSLPAFGVSVRGSNDTKGCRRVLASTGAVFAGAAALNAVYRMLIAVLLLVAIPGMQKTRQRW